MRDKPLTIAVTGLNATDNPAPGVGVLRALREVTGQKLRLVGLAYDALDPGVYAGDIVDDVFLIPYPSQGLVSFLSRMEYIHERVGLDVVLPTLDSELPSFIETAPRLREMGIRSLLPTREQVDLRAKTHLAALGKRAGISVPTEVVLAGPDELYKIHDKIPYPFFVKGPFYGATIARTLDEALAAYHKVIAQWGAPVLVQKAVVGEEFNVVACGDGKGGLVGAVGMKKMMLTDKGKGWAGITVKDPELVGLADKFMAATKWPGGCELEVMRDKEGRHHLIEVNPRFPAWVYLSAAAGQNLPWACVELALGREVKPFEDYAVGRMFVRISLDQVVKSEDFQNIVTVGEIIRQGAQS